MSGGNCPGGNCPGGNCPRTGFMKAKPTNDHIFRLSQTVMESFNTGEQVIAPFLDVDKAFDNVWDNGLMCIIFQLRLPA